MKRKGFTLVELLAVIAILAILVIIALPNVMGMFNTAKENSFKTEIKEIYKTAQNQWMQDSMYSTGEITYSRCKSGCTNNPLDLSGRADLEYSITIDKSGKVIEYRATDGTFQYYFSDPNGLKIEDIKNVTKVASITNEDDVVSFDDTPKPITADPSLGGYYNVNKKEYYDTFSEAVSAASSNQTIGVLKDNNSDNYEMTPFTVPAGITGLKIDFNGHDVYFNYNVGGNLTGDGKTHFGVNNGSIILMNSKPGDYVNGFEPWTDLVNNGTITIKSNARINSENDAILNNGTLIIEGGEVTGRESSCITNNGTITMRSGQINAYTDGINNSGTVNITGGTVKGSHAIYNNSTGTVNIASGVTINGFGSGIYNAGNLTVNGAEIKAVYTYDQTGVINSGIANITNATISAESTYGSNRTVIGIRNNSSGQLTLSSSTVSASGTSNRYGVYDEGTSTITDSTITSGDKGIYAGGNTTVTSGKVTGNNYGVLVKANKTLTLGKNDESVSLTVPEIEQTATNSSQYAGVSLENGATVNFYDGKVKGKKAFLGNGNINTPSSLYFLNTVTENGMEVSTLITR